MKNKALEAYHLNFHQTFAPETESISRILSLANCDLGFLTKEEISAQTTIPTGKSSGKVEPHIYYAAAMNLITFTKDSGKYKLELTDIGRVVLLEDPYLIENLTILLLHTLLVDKYSPATLWSFLFNEFFPQVLKSFNSSQIQSIVTRKFESNVNLSPFRTCYTSDLSFGSLRLLRIENQVYFLNPHKLKKEFLYVYSFVLLNKWENILSAQTEITIDEAINTLNFGKAYLWDETQIRDALDLMQDEGLIKINGQLSPITIIKNQNSEHCLINLYSLLI